MKHSLWKVMVIVLLVFIVVSLVKGDLGGGGNLVNIRWHVAVEGKVGAFVENVMSHAMTGEMAIGKYSYWFPSTSIVREGELDAMDAFRNLVALFLTSVVNLPLLLGVAIYKLLFSLIHLTGIIGALLFMLKTVLAIALLPLGLLIGLLAMNMTIVFALLWLILGIMLVPVFYSQQGALLVPGAVIAFVILLL